MKFGVTPAGGAKAGKWVSGFIFTEEARTSPFPSGRKTLETRSNYIGLEFGSLYIYFFAQEPSEVRMSLEVQELTCHWAC